jgi:hypothetical protein
VAAVPPSAPRTAAAGRLFFIFDQVSAKRLLVDTGSAYSIFPHHSHMKPFEPRLTAANGQRIRSWGSRRHFLRLAGQEYQWEFLQAAVSFPILGINFLKHFELLVDVIGEKLVPRSSVPDSGGAVYTVVRRPAAAELQLSTAESRMYAQVVSGASAAGGPAAGSSEAPSNAAAADEWEQLLLEFPAVVQPFTVSSSPKHGVQHHIVTTGQLSRRNFGDWTQLGWPPPRKSSRECWRQA